jgi:uncharacterized membrane protein (UPF0127 family)
VRPSDDVAPDWLVRRTRQAAWVLLALGIMAFLIVGANRPANPRLVPPQGAGLRGFGVTSFTVAAGPGLRSSPHPLCALLTRTPAQWGRGLRAQTSLNGFAGLVFAFDGPTRQLINARGTLLPLSIAWFDARGVFLASRDLAPCPAGARICPTYGSGAPYQTAIEVSGGKLSSIGIGPGSTLQLTGPCVG